MYAYSTDRTHIRVCSIVGVFADVIGGVSQVISMNGNMRGVLLPAPKANGIFLERYLVEIFCSLSVG